MADTEKTPARDPAAETQQPDSGEASTKEKPLSGLPAGKPTVKDRAPVCHGGICHLDEIAGIDKEI